MTPIPSPILARMIDANANRAREALRVLEDYARFGLDDKDLSHELKNIRHLLTEALQQLSIDDANLARDTPTMLAPVTKPKQSSNVPAFAISSWPPASVFPKPYGSLKRSARPCCPKPPHALNRFDTAVTQLNSESSEWSRNRTASQVFTSMSS